jgi:hypothetical protein
MPSEFVAELIEPPIYNYDVFVTRILRKCATFAFSDTARTFVPATVIHLFR